MFRFALVLGALLLSPAAFACGGQDCGGNCEMKPVSAHLDDVDAAAGTKAQLAVAGMKCGRCADKVVAALKAVDGVNAASVDSDTGVAKIAFDAEKTTLDALMAAIQEVGPYTASKSDKS